jgi:hypothetical protein
MTDKIVSWTLKYMGSNATYRRTESIRRKSKIEVEIALQERFAELLYRCGVAEVELLVRLEPDMSSAVVLWQHEYIRLGKDSIRKYLESHVCNIQNSSELTPWRILHLGMPTLRSRYHSCRCFFLNSW